MKLKKTKQRIKYIAQHVDGIKGQVLCELFDEIWFVRDSFAHSFVKLENIKYGTEKLNKCFSDNYSGRSSITNRDQDVRIFMVDVRVFVDQLVTLFITHQMEQIDKNKFFRLCDRLLKQRSLTQ